MKLIDADVLIEQMDAEPEGGYYSPHDVISLLMTQPVVEERKTGKWIHVRVNSEHSITGYFILGRCQCSECGVICEQEANYCPNCGADMRETP